MKQVRWICVFGLAAITLMFSLTLAAQGDPAIIQQKINSQFKLTTTTANQSDIVTPGDVVVLQKDGLRMSALTTVLTESNTYKDGKIGGGSAKRAWGSFGTLMLQSTMAGLDPTGTATIPTGIPPRTLASGDKCWVLATTVQKDGIVFKLLTDPDDNGIRYHADLKVLFPEKKKVPPLDTALGLIGEVLTVAPPDQPAEQSPIYGLYVAKTNNSDLQLNTDGSVSLHIKSPSVAELSGNFTVNGDTLSLAFSDGENLTFSIRGDTIYNAQGLPVYVMQGDATVPANEVASAPPPPQHQYDDVAPPPPPPPAASIGEPRAKVLADFGQPQKKVVNGAKVTYFYSDQKMKIVFTNGKVSNIE
jgi:hypothetical protein